MASSDLDDDFVFGGPGHKGQANGFDRSDQASDFSGILRMAEDVELEPKARANGSREPESSGGFSGILQLAEDARTENSLTMTLEGETPPPQNLTAQEKAKMDVIHLTCRKCERKFRVKTDRAGQRVKCPKCDHVIQVPGEKPQSRAKQKTSQGLSSSDFTALAKKLAAKDRQAARDNGPSEDPANARPSKKKGKLSKRKYRQLTLALEDEGLLSTDKLRARAEALRALGQSGDPRAFDWLAANLEHNELPVRQAAAVALGEAGDARGVPLLVALLDDHSLVLRKAAIFSLGKLKDPRTVKPLLWFGLENPQMKFLASEAIIEMDADAVQTLIELLNEAEPGLVLETIVLLGRIKDPRARRALTATMESQQPLLQCPAIEALGQLADPKTIGPLSRLLNDPQANVRVLAAAALAKMSSNKNTVAPLVRALKDADPDVVVHAARGLGDSGDQRAAEPLSRLLPSPEDRVRGAAAVALGQLGDRRAAPHLLQLLDQEAEDVQLNALAAMRTLNEPRMAGDLLRRLEHQNPAIRRRIVDVLGLIGDAEVAERLERLLRTDPADEVRMAAARALGEIADPASVDCLKDALYNFEFNVRCQAIGALGGIGDEECYNTLLKLLGDQVPEIRYHAASALGEVGNDKAVPFLKDLLKDKNPMVVRGAAKALEKLGLADVASQVKKAQRSHRAESLSNVWYSFKAWLPDSVRTQKLILGGSLAVLVLIGVVGWVVAGLFTGPPARVIVRGHVQTLLFGVDGTQLVVGRTMGVVELWDVESATLTQQLTPPGGSKVIGTPQPETLALVNGSAIQLWKINGENPAELKSGHPKPILKFAVTPDQRLAATMSADGSAILWNLATGQPRERSRLPARETNGFAVSADGSLFAGGDTKGNLTLWKTATGEMVRQFRGSKQSVTASCFHPDGKTLAVAYVDQVVLWNLETGEKLAALTEAKGLTQLHYHPKGMLLVGLRGATVSLWDAATLTQPEAEAEVKPKTIQVKADQLDALAFSPDGSKLAVGGTENPAVWIYETATGRLLNELNEKP